MTRRSNLKNSTLIKLVGALLLAASAVPFVVAKVQTRSKEETDYVRSPEPVVVAYENSQEYARNRCIDRSWKIMGVCYDRIDSPMAPLYGREAYDWSEMCRRQHQQRLADCEADFTKRY